ERVTREQAGLGVVARVRADVDRHEESLGARLRRRPKRSRRLCRGDRLTPLSGCRSTLPFSKVASLRRSLATPTKEVAPALPGRPSNPALWVQIDFALQQGRAGFAGATVVRTIWDAERAAPSRRGVLEFPASMARLKEPTFEEILSFCAEDPVERVFLEDVARRGLGRFTAVAQGGRLAA